MGKILDLIGIFYERGHRLPIAKKHLCPIDKRSVYGVIWDEQGV
jgi:hypothetical protein